MASQPGFISTLPSERKAIGLPSWVPVPMTVLMRVVTWYSALGKNTDRKRRTTKS